MRKIYLVRHGEPDTGLKNEKVCLGQKDVPMTSDGQRSVISLAGYFRRPEVREGITEVWSSPLKRCKVTAEILSEQAGVSSEESEIQGSVHTEAAFMEVNTGDWDGLSFREIRVRFPREFEERGKKLGTYRIPNGETLEEAGIRFERGLNKVLASTKGDLVVVAHAGVIRSLLCRIAGKSVNQMGDFRVPYASVTILECDENHLLTIETVGLKPVECLDLNLVHDFWDVCGTTEDQRAHMMKTAEFSMKLLSKENGEMISGFTGQKKQILFYSACLHDLLRSIVRGHEEAGAEWIRKKGFLELVNPVRMHNDPAVSAEVIEDEIQEENASLTIEELLYYADKRVRGNTIVSIEERFSASLKKCKDEIGIQKHRERLEAALRIERKLNRLRDIKRKYQK